MAQGLTNGKLIVAHVDTGADLHTLTVNYASEMLDATTFGSTTRKHQGGLKVASLEAQGYVNLGSSLSDPVLFDKVGENDVLVSAWSCGIQVGSTSVTGAAMAAAIPTYDLGGQVGTLIPFTFGAESQSDLVRAITVENALSSAWSTSANTGTAWNIVHCSTDEKLYAGLHVTALSTGLAATVTAVIQAASSSGFATSNTRLSFSAVSCKTGVFATPIAASALSTDQPFLRSVITVSTGTSTGATANGLVWVGVQ